METPAQPPRRSANSSSRLWRTRNTVGSGLVRTVETSACTSTACHLDSF
ncbi:unnamed protein product [Penicillium salamii]|uniref:Uncharacterized protein n=1 Tax=Penicillium salamii TaxID=1612424 RepID=A0A9W4IRE8_9EURO|nr:unnamed protein product [Penicillium salamii]CAG8064835.1 unnamed protein product [Penicillium salamii]CAG8226364.1 unnamed protein product [Penicillium salamii]CAG8305101.1 unnamed protein product [Penicillium salamii]CAG8353087.1 unnamed protein product [Penicillium salamii]